MYAIAFDLDTEQLRQLYPNANWNNAYFDIRRELEARGFRWQQGSVYFGNDDIRSTDCVKATMDLDALFPWFKAFGPRHPHAANHRGRHADGFPRL